MKMGLSIELLRGGLRMKKKIKKESMEPLHLKHGHFSVTHWICNARMKKLRSGQKRKGSPIDSTCCACIGHKCKSKDL